ncbi:MAG TPA: hypothetical protein VG838_00520 [Opitutaceae bacterium]|nr:hypothetical protein [Opitutaceae bacterium]
MGHRLPFVSKRSRQLLDPRSLPGIEGWWSARFPAAVAASAAFAVSQLSDLSGKARHLTQATGSAQPLLLRWSGENYLYAPGIAGNCVGTPDSAANSFAGDIDLRVRAAMTDWTPSAAQALISKFGGGGHISWMLRLETTGRLALYLSTDGTNSPGVNSSVSAPFSDGVAGWVRATWRASDGRVQFFTAPDQTATPSVWTQLGTDQSNPVGTLFDSDALIYVAARGDGLTDPASGKFYRAEVYNGIAGTLAVLFDASQAQNAAASCVSSTGETWTINATGTKQAQIVGISSVMFDTSAQHFLGSPSFTLAQPLTWVVLGRRLTQGNSRRFLAGLSGGGHIIVDDATVANFSIAAGSSVVGAPIITDTKNQVVTALFRGASSAIQKNKASPATVSPGTNGVTGGFNFMASPIPDAYGNWQITDLLLFSTVLDNRNQERLVNYLSRAGQLNLA